MFGYFMGELDENYKIILSVSQRLRCGPGGIAFVCVRLIHITKKNRQTAMPGVAGLHRNNIYQTNHSQK